MTRPSSTKVRFTESLSGGRYAEFERDANNDLISIVPARRSADCAASGVSGCLTYAYSGTTHRLTSIRDPRRSTSGGTTNYSLSVAYDGSNRATSITADATSTAQLRVVNFAASGASPYQRVAWQDADGVVGSSGNEYVRFTDFTPNGSMKVSWAPRSCAGNCSTATPTDKLAEYQTDGLDRYSTITTYRSAGAADPVITRRGTFASAAVDNYSDAITGALTAWDQTAPQHAASVAAGSPASIGRITHHDALGRSLADERPARKVNPDYDRTITDAGASLKGYWRLGDLTGTTNDLSSANLDGTVSGAVRGQPDAIADDADPAMAFDGTNDKVTTTTALPQSAYSLEAWVKPSAPDQTTKGLVGHWVAGGATIRLNTDGLYELTHSATTSNYVISQVKPVVGRWDHLVATWDSVTDVALLYINGRPVASGAVSAAPGTGGSNFEIGAYNAGNYFAGSIDEVAVYDRALTPLEIAIHYREGTAQFGQTFGHPIRHRGPPDPSVRQHLPGQWRARAQSDRGRRRLDDRRQFGRLRHRDGTRRWRLGQADQHWRAQSDRPVDTGPDRSLPGVDEPDFRHRSLVAVLLEGVNELLGVPHGLEW